MPSSWLPGWAPQLTWKACGTKSLPSINSSFLSVESWRRIQEHRFIHIYSSTHRYRLPRQRSLGTSWAALKVRQCLPERIFSGTVAIISLVSIFWRRHHVALVCGILDNFQSATFAMSYHCRNHWVSLNLPRKIVSITTTVTIMRSFISGYYPWLFSVSLLTSAGCSIIINVSMLAQYHLVSRIDVDIWQAVMSGIFSLTYVWNCLSAKRMEL